mmetsp:Transcript_10411/g.38647  ORF Transcript_10411/g.38647 Transcript_10411/m.38647 type:complete len:105 (+) Transcript_10411:109-423(+)
MVGVFDLFFRHSGWHVRAAEYAFAVMTLYAALVPKCLSRTTCERQQFVSLRSQLKSKFCFSQLTEEVAFVGRTVSNISKIYGIMKMVDEVDRELCRGWCGKVAL